MVKPPMEESKSFIQLRKWENMLAAKLGEVQHLSSCDSYDLAGTCPQRPHHGALGEHWPETGRPWVCAQALPQILMGIFRKPPLLNL